MAPPLRNVLETCLYVADMERAVEFYQSVIGLEAQFAEDRISGFRIGDTMLLLFVEGGTLKPVETPGGTIPTHDGSGPAHFALSIEPDALDGWRSHLESKGVRIESTVNWQKDGAVSLYFRDPDNHLVELATRGLWGID